MIRQRWTIGLGLGILLAIGAGATALDIRSRQDNPPQLARLNSIVDLIARRVAVSGELVRLSAASDGVGLAALHATPIPDFELPKARALRGLPFDRRGVVVRCNDRRKSFSLTVSGRPLRSRDGEITGAALAKPYRRSELAQMSRAALDAPAGVPITRPQV